MKKIPIISTVQSTVKAILDACSEVPSGIIKVFQVAKFQDAISVLKYDLPEIKIIDFNDEYTDAEGYLDIIESDPWLLFGGVIAIVNKDFEKTALEQRKNPNILFVTTRKEFETHAKQIISILIQQEHFLYNRRSHIDTNETETGYFVSETDPFEVIFYANLLGTYLYNTNRVNEFGRTCLHSSMMELLFNAVEHGNCNIDYDEKHEWLSAGKNILDLIEEKRKDPEVNKKKIYINYEISTEKTRIIIRDEGNGFDWRSRLEKELVADVHGMGIKMSQTMVKNLTYNDIGNQVSFEIDNQLNVANLTPAILKDQQVLSYRHMQIVCREGEESGNLFYICSGRYAVYVNNKLITVLTPSDIFLGEMAFLLDNRRTATIVSIGEGTLIKIAKMKFMRLMEAYPHYGIFMAKLVAGRLAKQSKLSSNLKVQLEHQHTQDETYM